MHWSLKWFSEHPCVKFIKEIKVEHMNIPVINICNIPKVATPFPPPQKKTKTKQNKKTATLTLWLLINCKSSEPLKSSDFPKVARPMKVTRPKFFIMSNTITQSKHANLTHVANF